MTAPAPKGYKRTEVGVIPEEWDVKRIDDFTDCTAGGTPSTDVSRYWGGDIRWMSSGELHEKIVFEVEGRITEEGLRNSSTKIVPADCILVGLAGQGKTRGTVAMNRVPLCTNQSIAAIFPNENFVPEYLFYNLENRYLELRSLSTGDGGRGGLNLTIIRNVLVPIPSLPEQRAIAAALSDADSLLASLDALIAKKRAVKQAAMHDLLTGKVRLPGFEGEWETKKLGETFTLEYGKSQKDIITPDGMYPILATSGEVGRTNQFLYDKPSIVIGRKGTIDTPRYVDVPFWAIDTTFYAVIRDEYFPKFLFYLLTTINWQRYNEASGVPSLNANTIYAIQVTLPASSTEQTAIAAVLSDLDAELAALERERAKWQSIKQGMMNDLLTGRVRLV